EVENIKMALDESAIVAITNQKGIITYVNDKFCEISKFSRTELIGKDHKIINSGYHSKGFIKDLWQTIATGKIWKGEIKNLAKDGSHYWVDTTIVPFFNDTGKPIQYIAIRADITEKKKVEADLIKAKKTAENSVKIKEEFLRNMSHEIRTPMNGIIGFTDLLLKTNLNSEQNEFLDRIKKSSNTLLVLTNDILDLSKLESGKLLFESIEFDLIDLIDQVMKMVAHSAKRKGIELSLFIDSKCPRYIKGDPTRLNQILLNLINNAVKFTEEGEVNIYVKPKIEKDDLIPITFKIEDTGIGMSTEAQKIIFDSFTQARSDTTRKYGGSGLGLAIVKMIVDQRKGEIHLDSKLGKGTTFTITIPFDKCIKKQVDAGGNSLLGTEDKKPNNFSLKHLKILLVEDNLMNQALAKSRLNSWNCKIDIADNGKIALEKLENTLYDLILMDIQMPEMDGYEATKRIRKLKPPICNIPIIAMTADASSNDEEKSLKTGMNDYISKPFNPEILYNKIISNTKINLNDEEVDKYIDLSFLKEESLGDNDLFIFLINTFTDNFESFLTTIKAGIKSKDFETIYKASHKIISNVRMIATEPLRNKISLIHDLSKEEKEMSKIPNLLIESEKIFAKMKISLQNIINDLKDEN
ncbi:ATP-binding protein, partial [Flavobacteriaceae bacterium]|nr:ATP-binding protein [Flavobacteriaceae bacterium]